MKLFEIAHLYRQALDDLTSPDNDLPLEVVNDTMEGLTGTLEQKAVAVAGYFQDLDATAAAMRAAAKRMEARAKSVESKAKRLRDYLRVNMEATGISKITCDEYEIRLRQNPERVVIDDAVALENSHLPNLCPLGKYEFVPDREAIKSAIKAGEYDVEGAHIERKKSVRIS